ncbi:MAG: DUF5703 domain-containing protein, partial [Thermoguttaceae bacterium]
MKPTPLFTAFLLIYASAITSFAQPVAVAGPNQHRTAPCNVVWTSPSHDAAGSMPLGNGRVGINLWVEEGGDLRFYISRTDSLSEASRLLKVGGVRISLEPNPFKAGGAFRQELQLCDGVCEITAGEASNKVTLKIFVDAENPVIHVIGDSLKPLKVKAMADVWRTKPRTLVGEELNSSWTLHGSPTPVVESADVFPKTEPGTVAWYHRNETSPAFASTLKVQSLESVADKARDPLLYRTFGAWMTAAGGSFSPAGKRTGMKAFQSVGGRVIESSSPATFFALRIATPCAQTETAAAWITEARKLAAISADDAGAVVSWIVTLAWWHDFWNRSWVIVDGDQAADVPGSEHPLRIGYDSTGGNRFFGQIEQIRVYGKALAESEIAQLAKTVPVVASLPQLGLLLSGNGEPRDIGKDALTIKKAVTLEARIKSTALSPGRIFDRITAGGTDGFLFDTEPGDTLRLIVGSTTLTAPRGILRAGNSYHVAATFDSESGAMRIYLDGRLVAQHGGDASSSVTRGYTLQRYMQACGGRGPYPIKFNGGMFTVEPKAFGKPYNADWRAWGDCHWWQNVRHMYHPMLAAGDFELMEPLFQTYAAVRPLAEARSRLYHGAEGCYFPETMTVWGTYSNGDYGWDRTGHQPNEVLSPWWQYAWNQGPEIVSLMLDRWDYTGDEAFLTGQVLPMAESVLKYFDTRFKKDAGGRIVLDPTQAVETYWHGVINDMPSTAGLNDTTSRLCALPDKLTHEDQRKFFTRMRAACPTVLVEEAEVGGKKIRRLAPAQKYAADRSNCENPELYGVWPFRLYGLGKPGLEEARAAYACRHNHLDCGWGYDGNCAALLGLTDEAARILKIKCANSHPAYRWPATWGPNFDWLPDQNHGGNLLETAQLMLLQPVGDK